jgi:hypothetical protein
MRVIFMDISPGRLALMSLRVGGPLACFGSVPVPVVDGVGNADGSPGCWAA